MLRPLLLCILAVCTLACSRQPPPGGEVVLYSSVDDFLLREVVAAFEAESGVRVRLVGDTEATKTTGLVERLLAERGRPREDVWWSSRARRDTALRRSTASRRGRG
jgi:iron(III) transport system substrate-binding protein